MNENASGGLGPDLSKKSGRDMEQVISIAGAVLILGAYAAAQFGLVRTGQANYNLVNLIGSALLAYVAIVDQRIGFILLEGAWALISIYTLLRPRQT